MTTSHQNNAEPVIRAMSSALSGAILQLLDRPVSDADLAAGADLAAQPAAARGTRRMGLLMFRVGDESAAVPATLLRRVTPIARTRPIPHVRTGVLRGICNIRGELLLCADLHRLLGLPPRKNPESTANESSDRRRMVVLGPADNSWAFEVDAIISIAYIDPAGIRPAPVTVEFAMGSYTSGLVMVDT